MLEPSVSSSRALRVTLVANAANTVLPVGAAVVEVYSSACSSRPEFGVRAITPTCAVFKMLTSMGEDEAAPLAMSSSSAALGPGLVAPPLIKRQSSRPSWSRVAAKNVRLITIAPTRKLMRLNSAGLEPLAPGLMSLTNTGALDPAAKRHSSVPNRPSSALKNKLLPSM